MATVETIPWDPADSIKTRQDVVDYLEAVYDDEGPYGILDDVLDDIKRAMDRHEIASKWADPESPLGAYIREESEKSLNSYRLQPNNLRADARSEEFTIRGGYANRQLYELVQNSADALIRSKGEHIWVKLTPTHLYCADNGLPIDQDGARALLFSHLSSKGETFEIGRFGLGFKSVLGVTDSPEFFSRSGSFRFDRERSAEILSPIASDIDRYPVLRLAEPFDPDGKIEADPDLREMSYWATNIVRLPLKPAAYQSIAQQIANFPAEFLLFVEHVGRLVLQTDEMETARIIALDRNGDEWVLDDAGTKSPWLVEKRLHQLSSDAKADHGALGNAGEVPIMWGAPLNRLNEPGTFWAFFPTLTQSLLSGILNAPWKTNEDRQNLLPGIYNDELIDAAASMVADVLPRLATDDDPARHFDALPRRHEAGDNDHADRLRAKLYECLMDTHVVPDQLGTLRKITDLSYVPSMLLIPEGRKALDRWASFKRKPVDWAHHRTLTRNRIARLELLFPTRPVGRRRGSVRYEPDMPKVYLAQWLRALVKGNRTVESSMAAIQTAALIPDSIRKGNNLGRILLTADIQWLEPDPDAVRLNGNSDVSTGVFVHPDLEEDSETLNALKTLGLRQANSETVFRDDVSRLLIRHSAKRSVVDWALFWPNSRDLAPALAAAIIKSQTGWRDSLRVWTIGVRHEFESIFNAYIERPDISSKDIVSITDSCSQIECKLLFHSLLPGPIVPGDGSRDKPVAIDVAHHEEDLPLLHLLGAVDSPGNQCKETHSGYLTKCRAKFTASVQGKPRWEQLNFEDTITSGPLGVLEHLSDEGKALYTWELLSLDDTYRRWTMRHDSIQRRAIYGTMDFPSPAIEALREHGRIKTDDGVIHKLDDGLGDPPENSAVLYKLLAHPKAASIRTAFGISAEIDLPVEPVGADNDSTLLIDVWPGLESHLIEQHINLDLVRCDGFQRPNGFGDDGEPDSIVKGGTVYVRRAEDEKEELQAVVRGLGLQLGIDRIRKILLGLTDEDVKAARSHVRRFGTDEERLLAAVGVSNLRRKLPGGLLRILRETKGAPLDGVEIAGAAIATFHTHALREYRDCLGHLDPPSRWAGSLTAKEFVLSLGFREEWAGEPNRRRDPYIEVDGPLSLPDLHDYQRNVVDNVRNLIRSNGALGPKRGMVSMPTGSGKTRVAVQSIVEAIRGNEYKGGVLWVADRDELCEQAVEAWREVWASEGAQAKRLRISRMWARQPRPLPSGKLHVIVASIQTLYSKIENQPESYEFLRNFDLVVFDEAHRSVAPTFTSVMEDMGLTRWRRNDEPILIGLTATPYRGRDEAETQRLVRRYSNNRLDAGAFASDHPESVIRELQDMRVLARADHATITGGDFSLNYQQLQQARNLPWLPRSVEDRISEDTDRTQRIIAEYFNRIEPDWPTLIFATSVEHSKTLAALLTARGIKARAVSGETDSATRRRVVEEFRNGDVKALVNYGVFREGFDAPKTRAIIVARPVYSPNLYFQMVGRGLRGVLNGGNDRCLILNVQDNIENYERKLAFSELDWLWDDTP